MKTYHIKDLLKKELLILELPEQHTVNTYADKISICNEINSPIHFIEGDYTLLGKPAEIKEEDAMELVEYHETLGFRNYKSNSEFPINIYIYKTATESLFSAIESVIFWDVNPIKLNPIQNERLGDIWSDKHSKWFEAELRTFDRNRTLILVKN